MKNVFNKISDFVSLAKKHHIGYHSDGGMVFEDTQHHFDQEAPKYICSKCGHLDDLSEVNNDKPVKQMPVYIAKVIYQFKIGDYAFNVDDVITKDITSSVNDKFSYHLNGSKIPYHIGRSIDVFMKNNSDYFKLENLRPQF